MKASIKQYQWQKPPMISKSGGGEHQLTGGVFLGLRFNYEDRTRCMTHYRFGSRAEKHSSQPGAAMRRNHYQINFSFFCDSHNLRSRFTMKDQFFHLQAGKLLTLGKFWQLTFRRILELFADVGYRKGLSHSGIGNC